MFFTNKTITVLEVPNEISLMYSISGCGKSCINCHSPELQEKNGDLLTLELFETHIKQYEKHISCICFLGGNWYDNFIDYCKLAKKYNKKVCLYTGDVDIPYNIKIELDFVKLGPYIEKFGGLDNINTNQKFIDLNNNINLNHLFQKTY